MNPIDLVRARTAAAAALVGTLLVAVPARAHQPAEEMVMWARCFMASLDEAQKEFEGHHLSLNFTLVGGQLISVTPSFFGSNPARVKEGPLAGLETLAAEQNLARKLAESLSEEQKKLAIIADTAPRDIITGQDRRANQGAFLPPQGIPFDQLTAAQQTLLLELVNEYAAKYRPPILQQIEQRTPLADGQNMHFAWAGGLAPGQGHYYRIQTPAFLFEYDNTQNDANHVHAVWRHFDGDFGEDLLRQHLEQSPHHSGGAAQNTVP